MVRLMIGEYNNFLQTHGEKLLHRQVRTVAELREVVEEFSPLEEIKWPLAIYDLSAVNIKVSVVLKFIEETPLTVFLLASRDNIPGVILSRCIRVVKRPRHLPITPGAVSAVIKHLTEDTPSEKESKLVMQYAPTLYPVFASLSTHGQRMRRKVLSLL